MGKRIFIYVFWPVSYTHLDVYKRQIHFLELDFAHPNELRAQLSGHKGTYNKFDYIVHCAGVTKCVEDVYKRQVINIMPAASTSFSGASTASWR